MLLLASEFISNSIELFEMLSPVLVDVIITDDKIKAPQGDWHFKNFNLMLNQTVHLRVHLLPLLHKQSLVP